MREKKVSARARRVKHLGKEPQPQVVQFEYQQWDASYVEIYGARYPRRVAALSLANAPVVG